MRLNPHEPKSAILTHLSHKTTVRWDVNVSDQLLETRCAHGAEPA